MHEMSDLFSGTNKKNIPKCCLLKFLPRVLSIKIKTITDTSGQMSILAEIVSCIDFSKDCFYYYLFTSEGYKMFRNF